MAVRTEAGLERQDMQLTFGEIAVSAAGTKTFGATTEYADGVILDCGATKLGGMSVCIDVKTAAAGGTQTFQLLASEDGSTWNVIATTQAIAVADLAAGDAVSLPIPRIHEGSKYKLQVVSGSGTTAGTYYAYVDTYAGV